MSATLHVDTGYIWHVDEIYVKVLGISSYLVGMMDGASRFILSHEMSTDKHGCDPTHLFAAAAAARAVRLPRILVSDGLSGFASLPKNILQIIISNIHTRTRDTHQKRFQPKQRIRKTKRRIRR